MVTVTALLLIIFPLTACPEVLHSSYTSLHKGYVMRIH